MARRGKGEERIPTLKHSDELKLLRMAKDPNGDPEIRKGALKTIIRYNLNLVKYIVKGYSILKGQFDEAALQSQGKWALGKAIEKFDVNSNNRFATYAGFWVRQFMQSFIHKDQLINQQKEIAADPNDPNKRTTRQNIFYFDRETSSGDRDSKSYSLADVVAEESDGTEDGVLNVDRAIRVNKMISYLDSNEALVIRLYYGISPINVGDIFQVADEQEKEEIKGLFASKKLLKRKKFEEISIKRKEVVSNPVIKKFTAFFGKINKTKEISQIIGKADGIIRKLKQKAIKKLKEVIGSKEFSNLS